MTDIKKILTKDCIAEQRELFKKYPLEMTLQEVSEVTGMAVATLHKRLAPSANKPIKMTTRLRGKYRLVTKQSVIDYMFPKK